MKTCTNILTEIRPARLLKGANRCELTVRGWMFGLGLSSSLNKQAHYADRLRAGR